MFFNVINLHECENKCKLQTDIRNYCYFYSKCWLSSVHSNENKCATDKYEQDEYHNAIFY